MVDHENLTILGNPKSLWEFILIQFLVFGSEGYPLPISPYCFYILIISWSLVTFATIDAALTSGYFPSAFGSIVYYMSGKSIISSLKNYLYFSG